MSFIYEVLDTAENPETPSKFLQSWMVLKSIAEQSGTVDEKSFYDWEKTLLQGEAMSEILGAICRQPDLFPEFSKLLAREAEEAIWHR